MQRDLVTAAVLFLLLTVITGVAYPGMVTGVAQIACHEQANGSLIVRDGRPIGSALIGQTFSEPKYFWSRPSATGPQPFNGSASSGSNLGSTNPALEEEVRKRVGALRAADPDSAAPVPVDLVTASASGLDPHISPAAAQYQLRRVARLRGLEHAQLSALVAAHTEPRRLGMLGGAASSVAEEGSQLDAGARRELAQAIVDESTQMTPLVSNVLDMTRLESGRAVVRPECVPLEEIVGSDLRGRAEGAIGGVGLGLAICRAIARAHGGNIRAERLPAGGALFVTTLPLTAEAPLVPREASVE